MVSMSRILRMVLNILQTHYASAVHYNCCWDHEKKVSSALRASYSLYTTTWYMHCACIQHPLCGIWILYISKPSFGRNCQIAQEGGRNVTGSVSLSLSGVTCHTCMCKRSLPNTKTESWHHSATFQGSSRTSVNATFFSKNLLSLHYDWCTVAVESATMLSLRECVRLLLNKIIAHHFRRISHNPRDAGGILFFIFILTQNNNKKQWAGPF